MKHILILCLTLLGITTYSQDIKLEDYSPYQRFCPSNSAFVKFSARDFGNNKISGDFLFRIWVDNIEIDYAYDNIQFGFDMPFNDSWNRDFINQSFHTDSNKDFEADIIYKDPTNEWTEGFGLQSNNIHMQVKFRPWHQLYWVTEDFYFISNVLEPGPAVVDGYDKLFFCQGGDIQIVNLPSAPPRNHIDTDEYCSWGTSNEGHWIWELPTGWKVTSVNGNLNTATNTYEGYDEVKIQAPSTLPGTATLNVRSEDDNWNWPINTETVIILGAPPAPTNILYENGQPFPEETCISGLFGREIDLEAMDIATIGNIDYLEWSSDAGPVGSSTTPDAYNTLNLMYPGTNRYVRVRVVNDCGSASAWKYVYFDLIGDPGCSEGGMEFFSLAVYPSPTAGDDMTVELKEKDASSKSIKRQQVEEFEYILYNTDLEPVIHKKTKSRKEKLHTRNLPNGKYYLRIITPYGAENRQVIVDNN